MQEPRRIVELALEAGFDLAALVPLAPPRDGDHFERWLAAGHQAGMDWFERQRARILDPRRIDPGARSLLVVGLGHARPAGRAPLGRGTEEARIARYALGRDYHNLIQKRLRKLSKELAGAGLVGTGRVLVDAGPLLERSHAQEAGLGFISKSANLLHPDHGPWFFLGELFLDLELSPEDFPSQPPAGSCGTCTACLDACPTDAIIAPGRIDANRCISYQTIENRGSVPHALRPRLGPWVFGCDVCSEVCPWGDGAPDRSGEFGTHPFVERAQRPGGILEWLRQTEEEFVSRTPGSPLRRPGRDALARNVALALGNLPGEAGLATLPAALDDRSPLVRAAAFWALYHAHASDRPAREALSRARAREWDPAAAEDMDQTLREHG
ncbi:MAG TPA: tRNA epoxyqueuosine(34) reductase QueG [Planctomycetes bacterium]|nr:tRNA epoxyqueuosine(34) reductase QueG [Planctomycetota bacterium]